MQALRLAALAAAGAIFTAALATDPARAACRQWTATHNGTDLFYPEEGGAAGTAANKLIWEVEQWKKEKGIRKVRIGRISTKCGDWFMKYLLPHKHCVAKARVCY